MTPRILAYAMIETGTLFCASSVLLFPWKGGIPWNIAEMMGFLCRASIVPLCFFAVLYSSDLYNVRIVKNLFEFRKRSVAPLCMIFSLLALFSFFVPLTTVVSSSMVFSCIVLMLVSTVIVFVLRYGLYTFGSFSPFAERILVLGVGDIAAKVTTAIRSISPLGYIIAGFVDDRDLSQGESSAQPLSPILGPLGRVEQIIRQFQPDRIIVALRERRGRTPLLTLLKAHWAGVVVEDGIRVYERFSGKLAVESLTPGFLIFSTDFKKSKVAEFIRRVVNLGAVVVGVIFTAPLFAVIAIAIKLDSKGSVFFIQERAGLNGRIFPLIKFRTMHPATTADDPDSVWRRDLHSRVTRVGRWLRTFHLDELPQLLNILRGDMDLVGPRPEMVQNIAEMEEQIPYYALRMAVRPGMTGWAQVKYGYAVSQEDVTEKVRYDLYYIKHRSTWLDCRILIETIKITFFGHTPFAGRHPHTVRMPTPLSVDRITVFTTKETTEKDTDATAA